MRPANPAFSSGPCAKRPGYGLPALRNAALGRSHRSALGKSKLSECILKTKEILGVPEDYRVGILPASDTGAFEAVMWSMLGPRPVDCFYWESFGSGWYVCCSVRVSSCSVVHSSALRLRRAHRSPRLYSAGVSLSFPLLSLSIPGTAMRSISCASLQ